MPDLTELQRLAEAVIPADGWEVLKMGAGGPDVRARHVTGASTWIAECRTDAEAAYIASMSPDTAKKLIAVALAAKEAIGWFPGPAAWHTDAPTKDIERLRNALENLK